MRKRFRPAGRFGSSRAPSRWHSRTNWNACRRNNDTGLAPKPIEVKLDPSIDMKTPPKAQVDTMPMPQSFSSSNRHSSDQRIIARMKLIGIEPGKSFDTSKVDAITRKAIEDSPAAAQKLME